MDKFVPKEKRSKKEQRKLNLARRKTWGPISPVTRKPENPKAYRRKKVQKGDDDFPFESFLFLPFQFFPFRLPKADEDRAAAHKQRALDQHPVGGEQ